MSRCVLQLKNITKTYQDGNRENTVLDDVSLDVHAGELVAVVGPSGSGKSTLLSIAGALAAPTDGEVYINGEKLNWKKQSYLTKMRREKIGFIFQGHQLIPFLTGKEQLQLCRGKAGSKLSVDKMVKDLGLEECINQYPEKMSGGERQRLAIARAFMSEPEIILADEPTASLDGVRGRNVVKMLQEEAKKLGKGVVMVTHDERMLDLVNKVYRIENGKIHCIE